MTQPKEKPETPKPNISPPVQKKAKKIDFSSLDGKLLLIRVGTDAKPASKEDIDDIESKLVKLLHKNHIKCAVFVTHHYVDYTIL